MITKIYFLYISFATFMFFGGWTLIPIDLFKMMCYACWGNIIGYAILVGGPILFLIQIMIFAKIISWIRTQLNI